MAFPKIENIELVTAIFGGWPSFHDAEVHWLTLSETGPSITMGVHTWGVSRPLNSPPSVVNHTMVSLRFDGVMLDSLSHLHTQNVLFDLVLEDEKPPNQEVAKYHGGTSSEARIEVFLDSSVGMSGHFWCKSVEVVSAAPYDPPERFKR